MLSLAALLVSLSAQAAASPPSTPQVPPIAGATSPAPPERSWPTQEGDYVLRNFRFRSGETLPSLRIHYTTLGTPHRNAAGDIDNAVMVLHGTGGTGKQFLSPQFAEQLYGPGQVLDITRYWIILPDNIGHGKSSKPSDGLRVRFPKYDYDDMVDAQHRLLRDHLGIKRMRLIMGTSMGCMHAFVWGETHPEFSRALMPLACEPVQIAGLNRMWRQLLIDGIKADPAWAGGDYTAQPAQGLRTAATLLFVAGTAPLQLQKSYPTRDAAADYARGRIETSMANLDANDLIYQVDSSRNYDPWPRLEAITAPTMWINSADDFINPRNFDFPQRAVARMKDARFRMIEESSETRGHGTHTWATFWKNDLAALLTRTARD
ncbi:alpha/beta fold hydrolase [Sphingosinicella sp. BN140058]|uniref:alpha/beta fold hydrolase n=1 Tax=Sphingosinicella sp. BN140058 TaxID=1892855 RepID=UPI0010102295|nr:alpha/beta fold hydrolase [Sphingosinicella sp. BN140058]QAY79224.1 alpha/beta fold hydrolase [Sphingosinicella sp. BN140058]